MNNNAKVNDYQVVMAIIFRLKTGCQWRMLPMKQFFRVSYSWQSVYYHFSRWSDDGSWERVWINILSKYKHLIDMSSVQLDGTHTPVKRGGEAVGYQGRKKSKTSNVLILTDSRGVPVTCSNPEDGRHNDAYNVISKVEQMLKMLHRSNIRTDGLFLNADAGFDTSGLREYLTKNEIVANIDQNRRNGSLKGYLFDEMLYKLRFVIERTNAWLDAFKSILIRFETNSVHWKSLILLAFSIILLRKL